MMCSARDRAWKWIEAVMAPLDRARMNRSDAELIRAEFANAARMLTFACDRGMGILSNGIKSRKTRYALANQMKIIIPEHRRLWLARNRVGGLRESTRVLERRLKEAGS